MLSRHLMMVFAIFSALSISHAKATEELDNIVGKDRIVQESDIPIKILRIR